VKNKKYNRNKWYNEKLILKKGDNNENEFKNLKKNLKK